MKFIHSLFTHFYNLPEGHLKLYTVIALFAGNIPIFIEMKKKINKEQKNENGDMRIFIESEFNRILNDCKSRKASR